MAINSEYTLAIGGKLDITGTQIQKELNAIPESQRTMTVYVKGDTTALKTLYTDGNKTYQTMTELDKEGKAVSTTLTKMSEQTKSLGERFVETTKKVAYFGASTAILGLFTTAIYKAVESVKDFDDAQTDFKKVSDLTGSSLTNYIDKLDTLGKSVARTRKQMCENI